MRILLISFVISLILTPGLAQTEGNSVNFGEASLAVGSYQGSLALSYLHDWRVGKKRKLGIGLGGRLTSYLGQNQYYSTAPAQLTSGSTSPTIIFQENINANVDSLLVKTPQVNALNLMVNFDYAISPRLQIGFNIDLLGFSFGGKKQANYINGANGKITEGSPTPFNLLLISDNDRGSLNSEFYFRYFFNDRWGIKAGAQFLFTEYTTPSPVQTYPEPNDRFRNKSLMFSFGVSYKIN